MEAFHWVGKVVLFPMKGEGFTTHAPPLHYIRVMGGCGVDQSSPLSEPSEVEKKERKKEGRKAIGQERERKKKRERERRKKKEEEEHRATPGEVSGSRRKLSKVRRIVFANF